MYVMLDAQSQGVLSIFFAKQKVTLRMRLSRLCQSACRQFRITFESWYYAISLLNTLYSNILTYIYTQVIYVIIFKSV